MGRGGLGNEGVWRTRTQTRSDVQHTEPFRRKKYRVYRTSDPVVTTEMSRKPFDPLGATIALRLP